VFLVKTSQIVYKYFRVEKSKDQTVAITPYEKAEWHKDGLKKIHL